MQDYLKSIFILFILHKKDKNKNYKFKALEKRLDEIYK